MYYKNGNFGPPIHLSAPTEMEGESYSIILRLLANQHRLIHCRSTEHVLSQVMG